MSSNAPTLSSSVAEPAPQYALARSPSFNAHVATARYEEAALQRAELETVKRENELLKARVKELEKSLQRANEASGLALSVSGS